MEIKKINKNTVNDFLTKLQYETWDITFSSYDVNMGRFIMFSVITNIYNKKTKGPTLMELFKATGNLKKFFLTTRDVRCVHHG
jgi:hypothetical protein